ncbi:hypothetical protein KCL50_001122 [Clostridium perfringens]|uniref:hypothetical protein n=1 Tax=Clostridium perfringens TaxID=1502 RepID=UPI0028CEDD45|nr:hypothetical protein [Clostridium perfringens]EHK2400159.1 hypothetical protein [Clostridium perfringens]MDT7983988.1 hypothetical protein [Clostridium perfringens]MDT8039504.1 hypothetical protein [Clostridium perfringens]
MQSEVKEKNIENKSELILILDSMVEIDLREKEKYEKQIANVNKKLLEFYKTHSRHSYSEVLQFFLKIELGNLAYFFENLDYFISKTDNLKVKEGLEKIKDHIQLEEKRLEYIRKIQAEAGKDLLEQIREAEKSFSKRNDELSASLKKSEAALNSHEKNIENHNETIENHKKSIDGINNQIITIIGIFSAIVITFFGGSELFSSALEFLGSVSKYRILFLTILISFVMFNTIFMLLNFISKLIGKELVSKNCKSDLKENKCETCPKKGKLKKCIKEKYPLVYWFDFICFSLLVLVALTYYIDNYNLISKLLGSFGEFILKR